LIQTKSNISTMLQSGVILEIYPRSFKSAHGGREGDLRGITEKLDYLQWLGVQHIWLPPIYPSPMKDGGYDVADYYSINKKFGTLVDFDQLIKSASAKGIGVIMDLVVNHTSIEHEWFKDALRSPRSPFRNRYIFRSAKPDGSLPNNHLSMFGGRAWEPVPGESGMYYYHTFAKEQPDLNYEHPAVLAEMRRIMHFWFKRGVQGIRVDAVHVIGKNPALPDEPANPDWDGDNEYQSLLHPHTMFQPKTYELISELCKTAAEYGDRFMIFEATPEKAPGHEVYHRLYGSVDREISAPFHFGLLSAKWTAGAIKTHVEDFLSGLPAGSVPVWNVSNHDQPRVASRVGELQAWVAMALILTLPGVPTLYYGDEIGMINGPEAEPGTSDDPRVNEFSRDAVRSVMQWTAGDGAGFTKSGVTPWLKPNADFAKRNVETQRQDPTSMLSFTKNLINLRRTIPALEHGHYVACDSGSSGVFAFGRRIEDDQVTIMLNFTDQVQTATIPKETPKLLFSQRKISGIVDGHITLHPNEVCILRA
jgi:alpha-glucosidase